MALTRNQKQKIIDDLKEKLGKQKIVFFVDIKGLKVKDLSDLRRKLKKLDSQIKISKKTLLNLAFKEKGISFDKKKLQGEVASVFGFKDEVLPAKTVYQFSLTNKNIKFLGGYLEGKFREAEEIVTLAQIPTREELLAKLVGTISAPVSNFVNVLEANIKGLLQVLTQIKT